MPNVIGVRSSALVPLTIMRVTGDITITREQIDTWRTNHPGARPADVKAFLQDYIASRDASFEVDVRVLRLNPLSFAVSFAKPGQTEPNWWI